MEQQRTKLPAAASSPTSSGSSSSSSSRSIHGSMSAAFLGVSSSTRSQSQRRSSPSLYPPPAPLRGHLASSRGSAAASAGSASGPSSASQFRQISPSPGTAAKRSPRPRSQITHSLPTPFLTELCAIRRIGANLSGHLNAQEMMPQRPLQQQQVHSSFSSLHSLPVGNFCGFPLPASLPQQMLEPFSSTDPPTRIFSGLEAPAPALSQHLSNCLAPLPSNTTIFQPSSPCSADHAQPSSDSELPPLPPSLEIPPYDYDGLPPPLPLGQLSQNSGSSPESSTGFVQSSSSSEMYELPPLPESLQMPPLQFPTSNLEDRLQLGGSGSRLMSMSRATEGGSQSREAMPTPASVHDKGNNGGGGSSSSSSIPWNCHGSLPMYSISRSEEQALHQLSNLLSRWSSPESSSSDQSTGSSVAGSPAAMPALAKKFDMMSIGGSSSSAGPEIPCNYSSLSVQNSNPVPNVPKLKLGGMDRPWLPALGDGASSSMSRRGGTKVHRFSKADMEMINKDSRLKELLKTDSKRVKRILRNRESVARLKVQKANHLQDLQRQADALNMECNSLSAQVQSHKEMFDKLRTENRAVQIKLEGLKELDNLKEALNQQLQSELQRLKLHS